MIPINSIEIPARFVEVASHWYGGQGCMLYAVCSTGGLTTGTICRVRDYEDRDDRNRKWYYSIWCDLSADVMRARRAAEKGYNYRAGDDPGDGEGHDEDYPVLAEFEDWVDSICDDLRCDYDLDDWDGN